MNDSLLICSSQRPHYFHYYFPVAFEQHHTTFILCFVANSQNLKQFYIYSFDMKEEDVEPSDPRFLIS